MLAHSMSRWQADCSCKVHRSISTINGNFSTLSQLGLPRLPHLTPPTSFPLPRAKEAANLGHSRFSCPELGLPKSPSQAMDATVPDEGVAVEVLPSAESAESSGEGTGEPECGPEGQPAGGLVEFVSNRISEMQPVSPDILRATSAGRALRFLARALSQPKGRHHLSFQTQHISCFWSHTWHGSAWKKRLTLLHIYLAPMAAVGSICAAALTTLLFSFKVLLPGFRREEAFRWPKSFWGSAAGAVTYLLVLLIAQPQTSVFLDAISIDQDKLP